MKRAGFIFILLAGCIEPFTPPVVVQSNSLLVVDGFINVNGKSTIILNRTQNLLETSTTPPETGAAVSLQDENGNASIFTEEKPGLYSLSPRSYSTSKYKLSIKTKDAIEYESDYVMLKNSPLIDSVTWKITSEKGVQVYVNTHDPENKTLYYRWTYEETWLYTSAFQSAYVYNYEIKKPILRTDNIFQCWNTHRSDKIHVATSNNLKTDVISQFPLVLIGRLEEKTRYKYSILVNQFALSKDAFDYWQQLEKTTEDLGTIFSPQPSQVIGNIKCLTNPNEIVLGFFAGGVVTEKRIFIASDNLPRPSTYTTTYVNCEESLLRINDLSRFSGPYLLTSQVLDGFGPNLLGYNYSTYQCTDCRLAGGTTTKPDFWQ